MLRDRLKEFLKKKGTSNYWLWKNLGINQGQLSCFFNGKKGLSLKKLEQIADQLGCEIIIVSREEMKREQYNKKKGNQEKAKKIAEREIEESVEKFQSSCPGFYVEAIDGPPIKLRVQEGGRGLPPKKGRNDPDSKYESEKRPKYRHTPLSRPLT